MTKLNTKNIFSVNNRSCYIICMVINSFHIMRSIRRKNIFSTFFSVKISFIIS